MDGLSFSGGEIAIVGGLLGAVVSGMGILFRALLESKKNEVVSLRESRDAEVAVLRKQVEAGERRENEWRQVALEGTLALARVSDANNKLAGGAAR